MEPAPPDPEAMEPTNAHSPDSWVGSEEAQSMHETTTSRREGAVVPLRSAGVSRQSVHKWIAR
jgi:hypothetical protein